MMKKNITFLLMALIISGCSFFETQDQMTKSAEELASDAVLAFQAEDYKAAKKAYSDLKDWYPFSRYAILAELKIADASFEMEDYYEAIAAYEEFEKMHPKNEAIPYVIYRIGMSWFNQISTVDRDSTPAANSLTQFNRLIDQFPGDEYAEKARENIKKCKENLSGHELYIADFYMKTEKYEAALKRYEYLVEHYPDSKESAKALEKIPEARANVQKN